MGAGLPSYAGLVKHCYTGLRQSLPDDQSREWDWPDRMLTALESRFGADQVRPLVSKRLTKRPKDLPVHHAILRLARLRRLEGLRLVTTNFDTFFERAAKSKGVKYEWHTGPMLPIPRNDHRGSWRSAVYLHGRLGRSQLVLNSADFGAAYLTDGWAARFVSRLFAEFTVLFIGYSMNDPVLRYMTDAFAAEAAEARSSVARGPAYIFVSHKDGEIPKSEFYKDRNLHPIFYNEGADEAHTALRDTLTAWANFRSDALASVSGLISSIAVQRPDAINPTDTSNLLWAVSERPNDNGHGGKVFSEVEPTPPIQWFDEFERREREVWADHNKACLEADKFGRHRPPKPEMHFGALFPQRADGEVRLSPTSLHLASWLVRHLGDRGLVERVIGKRRAGYQLHPRLRGTIRQRLRDGSALPAGFQLFWKLVTAEAITMQANAQPELTDELLQTLVVPLDNRWLRHTLCEAFRPLLTLSPSFDWPEESKKQAYDHLSQLVDAEVDLCGGKALQYAASEVISHVADDAFWVATVDDLTCLLRQTLDLYGLAEKANARSDPSIYHRPSITPHVQNKGFRLWTVLIDLLWHAWIRVDASDQNKSRSCVMQWSNLPYLAFRRLALAAMQRSRNFTAKERLELLING